MEINIATTVFQVVGILFRFLLGFAMIRPIFRCKLAVSFREWGCNRSLEGTMYFPFIKSDFQLATVDGSEIRLTSDR